MWTRRRRSRRLCGLEPMLGLLVLAGLLPGSCARAVRVYFVRFWLLAPAIRGDEMIYSNCKQIVGPDRTATSMQRLPRGSIICFGSTIDGSFCLDTLLVIASAETWIPAKARELDVSSAFAVCTADSVSTSSTDANLELTLYRGATFDDPVDGMFSFVPAKAAHHPYPRFARPRVVVDGLINAENRQSTWGSKRPLGRARVRAAWDTVVEQVLDADLVLAVGLDIPPREDVVPVPGSVRTRC